MLYSYRLKGCVQFIIMVTPSFVLFLGTLGSVFCLVESGKAGGKPIVIVLWDEILNSFFFSFYQYNLGDFQNVATNNYSSTTAQSVKV